MDTPSVYIETSIVSYLAARPSRDPVTLRNQQMTHAWWNTHRGRYVLVTSEFVTGEAARGDRHFAQRRLALLANVPLLASVEPINEVARALQVEVPLPPKAAADAVHIAFAAVHDIWCLLTWDRRHIANPRIRSRIERTCMRHGYAAPRLCTPFDLMGE